MNEAFISFNEFFVNSGSALAGKNPDQGTSNQQNDLIEDLGTNI